jgi:hypothetical protein
MRTRLGPCASPAVLNRLMLVLHWMDEKSYSQMKWNISVYFLTERLHGDYTQMLEAKAFRTFPRVCSLSKSKRLNPDFKVTLHKTLIRSIMTYACLAWKLAATVHLLKLQCLRNKVLCNIGNCPRCTPDRNLHFAFRISYAYDFITAYSGNKQMSYKIITV